MLCLIKCMSEALHVCRLCPGTHLAPIPSKPNHQNHLVSGPQLCSCWTMELSNPASAHITARGLPSKPVPHCGNQPYRSCHGKQAPSPLVRRRYCCKAPGVQNTDDAQMPPTSAGAVKPLQSEPELTVQPLQICGCSLCTAALLPHFSPPPPHPPSFTSPRSFSYAKLSLAPLWPQGGYPAPHRCVCRGELGAPGEEKLSQSSGHVLSLCCCCFLKEESCLASQEQNYMFTHYAAESPKASPSQKRRAFHGLRNHWDAGSDY